MISQHDPHAVHLYLYIYETQRNIRIYIKDDDIFMTHIFFRATILYLRFLILFIIKIKKNAIYKFFLSL